MRGRGEGTREQERRAASDHSPAIITIGSMSTVAWNLRSTVSCAAKHTETPSASRLPASWPGVDGAAEHDDDAGERDRHRDPRARVDTGSCSTTRAASAARNGDTLISTNVLATVVRVIEPMKKKNVPASSSPASEAGNADAADRARHRAAVHHHEHDAPRTAP